MRPMKNLIPVANWLLRLALLVIIYVTYFKEFETFKFNNLEYFVSLGMVLFGVALIVGAFLKKENLSALSGLVIFVLAILMMLVDGLSAKVLFNYFPTIALGFYFLAKGNQK